MTLSSNDFDEFRFTSRRDGTSTQWKSFPKGRNLQHALHQAQEILGGALELELRKVSSDPPLHKGGTPYILAIAGQVKDNKKYLAEMAKGDNL